MNDDMNHDIPRMSGMVNQLEEPQEWVVIWEEGCPLCYGPNFERPSGLIMHKGEKFKISSTRVPAGMSPSQEFWGLVVPEEGAPFWTALVYNTQPRAAFIEQEIRNEFHMQGVFKNGRWKLSLYGYHKNIPFIFEW